MRVIILAAGKGERLYPLTRNTPKSLIDLGNGMTLLEAQLESIQAAGVADVAIVGGYRVEQIEAKLEGYRRGAGVDARVIYNPFFDISNNLVSLWFARAEMSDPKGFVIVNGDDVFRAGVLRSLLDVDRGREICVVVSRKGAFDEDDMKVRLRGELVERISKAIPVTEAGAESIGMIRVVGRARAALVGQLDRMVRVPENRQVFWLEAFNELVAQGWPVHFHEVAGGDWCEIDFHPEVTSLRERVASKASWLGELDPK